jgi:tetratricopeptide (TPR) repeat protein
MKRNRLTILAAFAALWLLTLTSNAQQLKVPAPSPLQTIDQAFALSNIKIEYSRPSVKGRKIYGDLVPFGKIWRTGANASTKITFGENVRIDGKELPAGTYAVYSIPAKDYWDLMFYKDLALGGNVADYKQENEALRIKIKANPLTAPVETFTIGISDMTSNSANINFDWEKTRVSFKVEADIDSKIMKNIEATVEKDSRPYFQAATYYYETNKDMAKALEWVNKAIEQNPNAFWVQHLKAKIQVKMKDYKGAIATAEQSIALAKEAKNDDYVKMNEKLIEEAKKAK